MNRNIIASESFASSSKRHYFLDFKLAENNSNYIQITRSDQQPDLSYKTSRVNVFEKDFEFLIQAFAALFHSAAYHRQQDVGIKELREQLRLAPARGIKNWPESMRPREKLCDYGGEALEDAELLAILIGSGTPNDSAVGLAGLILAKADNDLRKLAGFDLKQLCRFRGMGIAKSCAILAAVEIAKRIYHGGK